MEPGGQPAAIYLSEHDDADHTKRLVEAEGRRALTIACDLQREEECRRAVEETASQLGRLDVLVNRVGTQTPVDSPEEITTEQWEGTFKTNVYSYFWTTKAALAHMGEGGAIINTGSVMWSPLIPATFPKEKVEEFGKQVPMGRAAQPDEIAPSYVFFASDALSSYYTGEVLGPIGGETLPG